MELGELSEPRKLAPVFVVKVSRPYFSTSPQGAREKLGLGTRLVIHQTLPSLSTLAPPIQEGSGNQTMNHAHCETISGADPGGTNQRKSNHGRLPAHVDVAQKFMQT